MTQDIKRGPNADVQENQRRNMQENPNQKIPKEQKKPLLIGSLFVSVAIPLLVGAFSAYLIYTSDADREIKRKALLLYAAQLAMNFFWSSLFFTYAQYLLALIWLLIMWIVILLCMIRFYRIRRAAGVMMGILFTWTTFAAYLNLACYIKSIATIPLE